jgi:hypothetical protein
MIVLACHIPYVFFAGKEGLCIFVDELDRKSISNMLWAKYQDTDEPPNPELPIPVDDMRKSYSEMVMRASTNGRMSQRDAEDRISAQIKASTIKIDQVKANKMAYKDMKTAYYLICVLVFYTMQVLTSLVVSDISIMFDFVSAFAVSFYAFLFPAWFYELAAKKYPGKAKKCDQIWARSFFFVGVINCALGLYSAIEGLIEHNE